MRKNTTPLKENGPPATSLHDIDTGSHSCLKWKRASQSATEHPAVSLLLSSSSSPAAAQGSIHPSYPVVTGLDSESSPAQTLPTVQTCRSWNGYRWLPVFAAAAATCPLCKNCHLADLFHSKSPHFPFRWKEEDKGGWQRVEPCLERGSSNPLTAEQTHVQTCWFRFWLLKGCVLMTSGPSGPLWYLGLCLVSGAGVWSEGNTAGLCLLHWCGCERLRDYWQR